MPTQQIYPEGEYQARITAWGFSNTRNGNQQFFLCFLLLKRLDPADPDATVPCVSRERTAFRSLLSEQAAGWLLSDLRSIGFTGTTFSALDATSDDAVDLSGRIIKVRCRHREYQGELRESWEIVRSASANLDRLRLDQVRELDSRFKAELVNHAGKVVTAAPSIPAQPGTTNPHSTEHPF